MQFQNHIQSLPISQTFKVIILDSDFKNNNPEYYQNYPSLFSNVFSIIQKQLDLLDISGYLYYQSTIFADRLIDEKDISNFPLITICQEESIKILTSIYGLESPFWTLWNERRNEYLEAIYLEKEISKKEIVTIQEYEILADKKSAFGKVAIDCLFSIDNENEDLYQQLLLSHKYFSVAFQLNDDIQDFKEDLKNGQFNWAVYLLQLQNISNQDPNVLEKYLYIRGVSKKMYELGIEYCDKSSEIVKDINVPKWKKIVTDTKKRFTTAIIEIDNYLEMLTSEISLSNEFHSKNSLKNSIFSAIEFVKSKQQDNGCWREYVNQGGISNTWSTAFIMSKISENSKLKSIFESEISKALFFLNEKAKTALWSYNTTWIEDADSTNFVFLSYLFNNKGIETELLEKWSSFQKANGGFSTYSDNSNLLVTLDDKNISDVKGWLFTHNCVSAVSFYFLANLNQESYSFVRIKQYFDENFNRELNSYWWTNNIYTYYYLAKTYQLLNDKEKLEFIINGIKTKQNENGSFSDGYGENLFYTGLALEILLLADKGNLDSEIEKGVDYLLENQYTDGSWRNSHALQVPYSHDINPTDCHFPIANFGMNVRAKEFNRLFTTSSILQSLSIYEYKYSSVTF
jgi:hypothetical protein